MQLASDHLSSETEHGPQDRIAYNARVVSIKDIHPALRVLRIRPDDPRPKFEPGQYVALGLGAWEPVVHGLEPQAGPDADTLIQRPYSLAAQIFDHHDRLIHPCDDDCWEFLVALVPGTKEHPAGLTPRLFALEEGRRLYASRKPKGRLSTAQVQPDDNVVFASTGTGEAPNNAMLVHLLLSGHRGQIASVSGARYRADFAYATAHRRLEQLYQNYRRVELTTREPENLDPSLPGFVGKQYVQDFFGQAALSNALGFDLHPERTQVFASGNPQMVGAPLGKPGEHRFSVAGGLCKWLESQGFCCDHPGSPGNVHFEQYGE